jgi:hypothetical protein
MPQFVDCCGLATLESWQNGYCTGLENRRPQGLGGSNPSLSAKRFLSRMTYRTPPEQKKEKTCSNDLF